MQRACAILSSVACLPLQYFSTLSHERHDFRGGEVTEHKMCVLISFTTFVWNISHSKKNWARYDKKRILVFMWSARYSYQILMKLEFSRRFSKKKNTIISNLMNICPVGAELFRADGQTDRHGQASSHFSQFCERFWKLNGSQCMDFLVHCDIAAF